MSGATPKTSLRVHRNRYTTSPRRQRGRFGGWVQVACLALISTLSICLTTPPSVQADAQDVKSAARALPGAGQKLDAAALTRIIDAEINARLQAEGIPTSSRADDAEFLRRLHLDLNGAIPPLAKVTAFLDSKDPNKRPKLVEELLADPKFGRFLAELWVNAMIRMDTDNIGLQTEPLQTWLADAFNNDLPWDRIVRELLTATGDQDKNPATTYFIGNPTVDKMTDSVTRLFLGVQLQCAQCHNHPFTDYKQSEYWGMAQFFTNVRLTVPPKKAAKSGVSPGIFEVVTTPAKAKAKAKAKLKDKAKAKAKAPEGAMTVPAKFLRGSEPRLNPAQPSRPVFAQWLLREDNPYFAQAFVNRMWARFFGRGFVNPIDDIHDNNPASHPVLLTALTEQFKANDYDIKYLIRAIVGSQAYQRTSRPNGSNASDTELFSRMYVRVLSPEQLYDSLTPLLGPAGKFDLPKKKGIAKAGAKGGPRQQFINFFRIDEGADPLEYQHGIPQALRLMNAPKLSNTNPLVNQAVLASSGQPAKVIEYLYLAALARRPTAEELARQLAYVRQQTPPRIAYGDIAWALLNCSEFALNH